jgi:hypothetical protein
VVIEKSLAVGIGGIVSHNVRMALSGISLHAYTVVAGLGGRAITKASLRRLFERALARRAGAAHLPRPQPGSDRPPAGTREGRQRRSGPSRRTSCATSAPSPRKSRDVHGTERHPPKMKGKAA